MKNKKWLRSVAFILVLVISVLGVLQCYGLPQDYYAKHITNFEYQKEYTIDGALFGTSVVAHAWVAPKAWDSYGITAYHLSMSVQPFGIIPDLLDYAQETQDIKYAMIDIHGLRRETVFYSILPAKFRAAYLNIADMPTRIKVLETLFEFTQEAYDFYGVPEKAEEVVDFDDISYYIPFLNFHRRWVDGLTKDDFVTDINNVLGADNRAAAFRSYDCTYLMKTWDVGESEDIDDFQKAQLQKIFDYAEENNIKLLFFNSPSFRSKAAQEELSNLIDYCKKMGYDAIDFSDPEIAEEIEFDPAVDMVDKGHLNAIGGMKVTDYLCRYLIENDFYTPDHRGDEYYAKWNEDANRYMNFYNKGLEKLAEADK